MPECRIVGCKQERTALYDGGSQGDIDLCALHTPKSDPLAFRLSADSGEAGR